MDEAKKKQFKIGIIVACLVLAVIILITTWPKSAGGPIRSKDAIQMLCVNEECNAQFELSQEEYKRLIMAKGRRMVTMGPQAFTCTECAEESAYTATKCKECGLIFTLNPGGDDFQDRCPECGYSGIEERVRKK